MKRKGDFLEVRGFEAIYINDCDNDSCRVSFKTKDGSKFWIVIPKELIVKRVPRK